MKIVPLEKIPFQNKMNFILMGPKGVGKTTLGKYLAIQWKKTFVDTDVLLESFYQKKNKVLWVIQRYLHKGRGTEFSETGRRSFTNLKKSKE